MGKTKNTVIVEDSVVLFVRGNFETLYNTRVFSLKRFRINIFLSFRPPLKREML